MESGFRLFGPDHQAALAAVAMAAVAAVTLARRGATGWERAHPLARRRHAR